jgi:protein phosphatase
METASSISAHRATPESFVIPRQTLIVLCGPAGSGKSTFAHRFVERHYAQGCRATTIVSSDYCRALICDEVTNQQINRDTFDLFYYIIQKRMFQHSLTIADSTALIPEARHRLVEMARRQQFTPCLVVFNMSLQTCIARDREADRGRVVGEQVIAYHIKQLQRALREIPHEGWNKIYILDDQHSDLDLTIGDAK